jgi:hypothetical protein
MVRGAARLNLRQLDAMPYQANVREHEQLLSAYIPVAEVAALFEECRSAGAEFQQTLETKPWGGRRNSSYAIPTAICSVSAAPEALAAIAAYFSAAFVL